MPDELKSSRSLGSLQQLPPTSPHASALRKQGSRSRDLTVTHSDSNLLRKSKSASLGSAMNVSTTTASALGTESPSVMSAISKPVSSQAMSTILSTPSNTALPVPTTSSQGVGNTTGSATDLSSSRVDSERAKPPKPPPVLVQLRNTDDAADAHDAKYHKHHREHRRKSAKSPSKAAEGEQTPRTDQSRGRRKSRKSGTPVDANADGAAPSPRQARQQSINRDLDERDAHFHEADRSVSRGRRKERSQSRHRHSQHVTADAPAGDDENQTPSSKDKSDKESPVKRSGSRRSHRHSSKTDRSGSQDVSMMQGEPRSSSQSRQSSKVKRRTSGSRSRRHRDSQAATDGDGDKNDGKSRGKKTSPLFEHVGKQPQDFDGCVTNVRVVCADALVMDMRLRRPLVQVHIVDETSGQYLAKKDKMRPVTTFNEPPNIDFILPAITKPFDLIGNRTQTPQWNDSLVFNEDYLHIITPGTMILFEVLDMLTDFKSLRTRFGGQTDGWHRVAWAFLKLVNGHAQANTETPLRLQLYKYPWWVRQGRTVDRVPYIYRIWSRSTRYKYPSTLTVAVEAVGRVETRQVVGRPRRPNEKEIGRMSYEQMMRIYNFKKRTPAHEAVVMRSLMDLHATTEHVWRRKEGQMCKIPNKVMFRISGGENGAFACAFSTSGLVLAVACANRSSYPIKLYDILTGDRIGNLEGHLDLVYQLSWTHDDSELVSASADGSVRVWRFFSDGSVREAAIYQHPTFVYSAAWRPEKSVGAGGEPMHSATTRGPKYLATGAYDGSIRFWAYDPHHPSSKSGSDIIKPVKKIPAAHSTHINALTFDTEGHRLFSGDASGILKIWTSKSLLLSSTSPSKPSTHETDESHLDYECLKSIDLQTGSPIHSLKMHPSGRRLVIQTPHSIHTLDTRIFRFLTYIQMPSTRPSGVLSSRSAAHHGTHRGHADAAAAGLAMLSSTLPVSGPGSLPLPPLPHPMGDPLSAYSPSWSTAPSHGQLPPLAHRQPLQTVQPQRTFPFTRATLSPCGTYVLCGSAHGSAIHVWRVETGTLVATYDSTHLSRGQPHSDSDSDSESERSGGRGTGTAAGGAPVVEIAFHPHDHYACFVQWGSRQGVSVWKWDAGTKEIGVHDDGVMAVAHAVPAAMSGGGQGGLKTDQGSVGALRHFDVEAIVAKSLSSRLNLAECWLGDRGTRSGMAA
ncbi:hypothetical protein BC831DRAFT_506419 [Entophlyctis helioformis]|nr:hypothetical protein BC831DRAFT_506419 [Entophlyctis helioformis]